MSPTTTTTAAEPPPMVERETSNMGDSIPHSSSSIDDTTTSLTTDDEVPLDKCRLTLLLVSGKRHSFDFDPYTTVDTVKTFIMEHWPQDWAESIPSSIKNIEFVYLGRFLDNPSKLKDNGILGGHSTIVHLVIRQHVRKSDNDKTNDSSDSRLSFPFDDVLMPVEKSFMAEIIGRSSMFRNVLHFGTIALSGKIIKSETHGRANVADMHTYLLTLFKTNIQPPIYAKG
ncbi:hypothetical protein [Absidia glauca]|uniref:UBL3-like ubiquitin domain-containing protein n=1 Tax=Absidia glauca TaxID=4829 RepID=A0A168SYA6_ABSGL|nr:hypothetical protein [Absidia glauca]